MWLYPILVLRLLLVGVSHPKSLCTFTEVFLSLFLLFFPLILIFTGWTVYHQTSERVTYKSSSKPRARFLSGPVSLSICLYLLFSTFPHTSHPSLLSLFHLYLFSWPECVFWMFLDSGSSPLLTLFTTPYPPTQAYVGHFVSPTHAYVCHFVFCPHGFLPSALSFLGFRPSSIQTLCALL